MTKSIVLACLVLVILAGTARAEDVWVESMDLEVRLDPPKHRIDATAVLHLAPAREKPAVLEFRLHAGLAVELPDGVAIEKELVEGWWKILSVKVPAGLKDLSVKYSGEIYDAVEKSDALSFVVGDDTRGVIGTEGVFLVAGSGWYPMTDGIVVFRSITVDGPGDWRVVTQGKLDKRSVVEDREHTLWTNVRGMDGLALQAGNYVVTTRQVGDVKISTYLFAEDQKHAELFLSETQRYFEFYAKILGEYPWPKFDIVENFFTTGYGMPSYTLLGQKVLPVMVMMAARNKGQIPAGYIAHELVHCWWGNYIYPDYSTGNWCEGLTSWYSNYLMKDVTDPEKAFDHRKRISTTFAIRVGPDNDYPLREFRGKTEDFENDIGYGKSCMVFHMLALRVGYDTYFETMRGIIKDFGGKRTGWDDFEAAFSKAAGEDLSWFFDQWLDRKGTPNLSLSEVAVKRGEDGMFHVTGRILQDTASKPWRVRVPVALTMPGGNVSTNVEADSHSTAFEIVSPRMPVSVELDPRFFLLRHVPLDEIQPCLNLTLERPDKVFVVPEGDKTYAGLAAMAKARKGGEIVPAADGLPKRDCMVLGRPEVNPATAAALAAAGATVEGNSITLRGKKYEGEDLWVLLSIPHPEAPGKFVTVYFGMTPKALGRSSVIFHYGWDGHLVYQGRRPQTRGEFTRITPRTIRMIPIEADPARIEKTVRALAAPEMKGRLTGSEGAQAAFNLLLETMPEIGYDEMRVTNAVFAVRDFDDPDAWSVAQGKIGDAETEWKASFPGAVVPAVFSKAAPDGIRIKRIVPYPEEADKETLLVLPAVTDADSLSVLLASLVDSPAAAIAIPMKVLEDRKMADCAAYPSRNAGGRPVADPLRDAAGRQARAPRPSFSLPMPVVFLDARIVPPGGRGPADARLRVRFTETSITAKNLEVFIHPKGAGKDLPAVGLMAHRDGCGEGFPSADDNASGVAAVLETIRALVARRDLLARPVRIMFTDAEEWGLRGAETLSRNGEKLVAVINLDTVGAADQSSVHVIGRSHYPHLSARAISCLQAEGLTVGKDIDKYAFAHGSDHWPFHRRGVPAIDLWSGQYRRMNTKEDTIDKVDFEKIAAISRATTRLVLDLATEK